uniref:Arf-GAP domain-containing protein n=1 Tax=Sinocyclocheilus grahami TaxID=75366 RepID=A0A672JX54_SINGR
VTQTKTKTDIPTRNTHFKVAHRLWSSPCNKVCADCGAANPEWASVNLLVVICEACAGAHRSMSTLWIFEVYMRCGLFL